MCRARNAVVLASLILSSGSLASATFQTTARTLFARAQEALRAGRYAEALRQGVAFVAKDPKSLAGRRLVAQAALALDQPDRAEAEFRQALRFASPAARPSLQRGIVQADALRQALRLSTLAQTLKTSGDLLGAAKAQEAAYHALPSRYAFGIAAAELFEAADRLEDARRVLESVRARNLSASAATHVPQRLASLQARIEAARRQATEALAQKQAEERKTAEARQAEDERQAKVEARRAKEAEQETQRQAEEERAKAEKIRRDREETDRLTGILDDQRRAVREAESARRKADESVDDAERAVRKFDGEADDARERRERTKRDKEALEDKLKDAKEELARQLLREDLRTAQGKYDDAKEVYEKAKRRLDDVKSRLSQAKSDADDARRKLESSRQDVRDTEDAISRVTSGG